MSTTTRRLFVSSGQTQLLSVAFGVATAVTHDGTNYWTMTAWRRKAASGALPQDTYGEQIGSLTTHDFDLAAGKLYPLYASESGVTMNDGDELWATQVSSGSPALLDGPTFRWETVE